LERKILYRVALVLLATLALVGCGTSGGSGGGGSQSHGTTPQEKPSPGVDTEGAAVSPEAEAGQYALGVAEQMTGERPKSGCLEVAEVEGGKYKASEEAEHDAACIYAAAFAGCLEGQAGEPLGPASYKEEFPEKGLQRVYEKARAACKK
jgi:hypothetical protein